MILVLSLLTAISLPSPVLSTSVGSGGYAAYVAHPFLGSKGVVNPSSKWMSAIANKPYSRFPPPRKSPLRP